MKNGYRSQNHNVRSRPPRPSSEQFAPRQAYYLGQVPEREFRAILRSCRNVCVGKRIADGKSIDAVMAAILELFRASSLMKGRSGNRLIDFGDLASPASLMVLTRAAESAGVLPRGLRNSIAAIAKFGASHGVAESLAFAQNTITARPSARERIIGDDFLSVLFASASSASAAARPRWITILAAAAGAVVGGAAGAAAGGPLGAGIGAGLLGAAVSYVFGD
jgi:hypothetical protein